MSPAAKFPPQLIERLQRYFKDRLHQDLTTEEADLYLDSLGSLFLVVWNNRKNPKRPAVLAGADGPPAGGGGRPP